MMRCEVSMSTITRGDNGDGEQDHLSACERRRSRTPKEQCPPSSFRFCVVKRRLPKFAISLCRGLSLGATVAAVALSLTPFARFAVTRESHVYVFTAHGGRLFITHVDFTFKHGPITGMTFEPIRRSMRVDFVDGSWNGPYLIPGSSLTSPTLGFESSDLNTHTWVMHRRVIPLWPLVLAAAALTLGGPVVRGLRCARRGQTGQCPTCGYDLRATPDRCPECGTRAVVGDARMQREERKGGESKGDIPGESKGDIPE
jgi:hypothetical protein